MSIGEVLILCGGNALAGNTIPGYVSFLNLWVYTPG